MDARKLQPIRQPIRQPKRQFAPWFRSLGLAACVGAGLFLAAPVLANTLLPPGAAPAPEQRAAPPKRQDLRLAVQSRDKAAPARQLSPEELAQMRAQIRELGRARAAAPRPENARERY
jgi:hypothetical protein